MIPLPYEIVEAIILSLPKTNVRDLRALTSTCAALRACAHLCWRHLEITGLADSVNQKLLALDEHLGKHDSPSSLSGLTWSPLPFV